MPKNKTTKLLKELVISQKQEFKIQTPFSYRFDNRTGKLVLLYTLPQMTKVSGKIKVLQHHKQKYRANINQDNWRKYFKGKRSIVIDDAKWVEQQKEDAAKKYDVGMDEYDFKWWVESYCSRSVGKTKTIKKLSDHTIRQNKYHIGEYYEWLVEKHSDSVEIGNHIDTGAEWYEEYYEERLNSGRWSPTTIGISFRNIRAFYNFIADRSKSTFPYDLLKRLKIPQAQNNRDGINNFEYEKILDFITNKKDDLFWGKYILLLRLQLKSGMRVGELVNIKNRNINTDTQQMQIVGKGEKSRVLNFNHKDDEVIWNDILKKKGKGLYLFHRTKIHYNRYTNSYHSEVVIDENKPTTSSYYLQRFRQMREMLGLRGKGIITSHSLRRYFITRFVSETKNRDLVRQIVGHSSTRMTDYYVGNMIEENTKTTISIGV